MEHLKESKLIHFLRALEKKELGRFAKFLQSPYFNNSKSICRLFGYLRKQWPDFDGGKLDRKKVFQKLFGSPYDYKTFENYQTRLTALLQEFLSLEELEKQQHKKELLQLKMLHSRGLDGYFEGQVSKIKKNMDKSKRRDAKYHLHQFESSDLLLFHPRIETTKGKEELYSNLAFNLDTYYLLNSLKISSEHQMSQRDLKSKTSILFNTEIEKMAANPVFKKEYLLQMYRMNLQLFQQADFAIYKQLKQLLLANISALNFHDKETLFGYLLAHTGHLGLSKSAYWQMYFDLYRIGFQENILLTNGQILPSHFLNAVVLATEIGELEWLGNFLVAESPRLPEVERDKCRVLGQAYLAYGKGKFEDCIQALCQVDAYKGDPYFALRVFPLEIRANYELAAKFKGDDFVEAWKRFDNYLKTNEAISENRKMANLNFLLLVRKLYKAIYKKQDKEQLLQEIQELEPMVGKAWCLKKCKVN